MRYSQLIEIMDETGLSPEQLSARLNVSNMTYRRWLKCPPSESLPKEYERNVAGGIYVLLAEGKLSAASKPVAHFLKNHLPEFFMAAVSGLKTPADLDNQCANHQEQIVAVLSQLGGSSKTQRQVDNASGRIQTFTSWGEDWKTRVRLLSQVVASARLALVDKLVAYGALFYLILPFDLIPDAIPLFGYVDDFAILGFASAYYYKRYPSMRGR